VLLLNNLSPQGATVNGNSTTVVSNASPTQLAVSQGVISPPQDQALGWAPSDSAYVAWTYDPALTISVTTPAPMLTSGTVYLFRINIRATTVVTNIVTYVGVIGATLTAGQNLLGLYKSDGTRIGITADQSGVWTSTGLKTAALVSGPFTLTPGFCWAAILSVGTTPPVFARLNNVNATIQNAGAAATTNFRCATNVAGVTALPSPLVLGSSAAAQNFIWVALS
jgi:hypothetical protein